LSPAPGVGVRLAAPLVAADDAADDGGDEEALLVPTLVDGIAGFVALLDGPSMRGESVGKALWCPKRFGAAGLGADMPNKEGLEAVELALGALRREGGGMARCCIVVERS
jgi:hypothetical protein